MRFIATPNGLKSLSKSLSKIVRYRKLAKPFLHERGCCRTAPLRRLCHIANTTDARNRSTLVLYENGIPLHRAHAPHEVIRKEGKGAFSRRGDVDLFFQQRQFGSER